MAGYNSDDVGVRGWRLFLEMTLPLLGSGGGGLKR